MLNVVINFSIAWENLKLEKGSLEIETFFTLHTYICVCAFIVFYLYILPWSPEKSLLSCPAYFQIPAKEDEDPQ